MQGGLDGDATHLARFFLHEQEIARVFQLPPEGDTAMAELNISERQAGDVTVLDLSGKITIGEGSVSLRSAIRRLLEEGKKKILLNLGQVSYVDSSGVGELVAGFTTVTREGGQLKLLNLTRKIQDLLAITKLLTVFDVYDDEAAALNSFK